MIKGTEQQDVRIEKVPQTPVLKLAAAFAGISLLLWGSYQLMFSTGANAAMVLARSEVQTAVVSRGDFVRDLAVQGKVVAANAPTLVSQQDGLVRFVKQPGEAVTIGDLLAVVESPSLENEVKQQQALLLSMQSEHERAKLLAREQQLDMQQIESSAAVNLQAAKRELARAEQSMQLGVMRQIDLDIARDKLAQTELEYKHARAKVALAADKLNFEQKSGEQSLARQALVVAELERKLAALQIKAPVTGQVGNWLATQQTQVLTGQGLLTVIDLSQYEAELSVPENYAADLSPGLAVEVTLNGQKLAGQLSHVAAEVKDSNVTARVRFADQDAKALRQNQRVTGRIVFDERKNVLRIARGEFVSSGGGRIGYRLEQDVAVRTPLELGALSVQWVEIINGAKEGDELVVSSLTEFKDAARVRLN
ncbi:efflux RND transporter periplasmic adaptor subunit [Rheinheimera texasensis]|uniref:efflux RND transporter periplasmic adaptor subunit n=1 Tax=Rheinheimera texasensis TaxID=306205 RepID=UPI0004E124E7|nr:HlyD family efflux transporter periplasmic adaptor subunit [Rheinheimera texasensis]